MRARPMGARYQMLTLRTDCGDIVDADRIRRAHRCVPLITCCSGSSISDVGICGQGGTYPWGLQL